MLTVEKVALLASTHMFSEVPARVLASLAGVMAVRDLAVGDVVMTEGEPGEALFVVVDGSVRVDSGPTTIQTLGRGAVLGELALLDPAPRSATVTAETPCRLLELGKEDFDLVMADEPQLPSGVIRYLVQFIRRATAPAERT